MELLGPTGPYNFGSNWVAGSDEAYKIGVTRQLGPIIKLGSKGPQSSIILFNSMGPQGSMTPPGLIEQ